ncbi:hypothetical protein AOQ84DRAFT_435170 [Glonium stellatum]|uniref:Uncharacterized protein n=1 Tax=Glonium stellatum TaxID=574774 RepID=A0A8E2FES5_9PEZI|nr:hypothetical protein AOQ84DRAFT_435170 [Glonium stellatum]
MVSKHLLEGGIGGWHLKTVSTANGTTREKIIRDNATREFVGSVPLVSFIYLLISCIIFFLLALHILRWLKAFSRRSRIRSPLSLPPRFLPSREFEARLDRLYQDATLPARQAAQSSQSIPDSAFGPSRSTILIRSLSSLSQKMFSRKEKQETDVEMQENPVVPTPVIRQPTNPPRPVAVSERPDLMPIHPDPYIHLAPYRPPVIPQEAPRPQPAPQQMSHGRDRPWGSNNLFTPHAVPRDPGYGPAPTPATGYYPDEAPASVPVLVSASKNGNEHATGLGGKDGYQLFKRRIIMKSDARVQSGDIHECRDLVRARYAIGHTIMSIRAGHTTAEAVGLRLPDLRNRGEFVLHEIRRILGEWSGVRSQWNEEEWGLLQKIQRKLVVLDL